MKTTDKNIKPIMEKCCVFRLESEGIVCRHYESGSTPGCSTPLDSISKLTGVHPGNYVFFGKAKHSFLCCIPV